MGEAALAYAGTGWAVFPLFGIVGGGCQCRRRDCPRPGKHPLVARGLHEASTDAETVRAWWRRWPGANIGVATGAPSGIVVIDVDMPGGDASLSLVAGELGPLPATLEARTGGGGRHLVYRHPGEGRMGNTVGKLHGFDAPLPHVDLRADGGAIVVAPSLHISGNRYRWVDPSVEPAPAPQWLREPPRPAPVPIPAASMGPGGNTGYGLAALRRELAELAATEHGENNRLNQAAFSLGMLVAGGELDRGTVEAQLAQVALGIGLHPAEISRTIASGLERGTQLPRVAPHRLRR
jgi:hypothetical protein